ncbi:hypothetical protein EDD86DRAFT_97658 [Gorgonomyces haynaldii]|nr:hypothetical protein EDD86DRAFT_97658 [Gorgonomyces haynaldii]
MVETDASIFDPNDATIVPYPGAYYVYGIGWPIMQLGFLGSVYVMYRIIMRMRKGPIPLQLRFPLYIAISDIILYIGHMNNQMYPMIYGRVRPLGLACDLSAGYVSFGIIWNNTLVLALAFHSYCTLVLGKPLDMGRYDWKMLVITLAVSFAFGIAGGLTAGPSYLWCYTQKGGEKLIAIFTAGCEVVFFNLIAFFFYKVYKFLQENSPQSKALSLKSQLKSIDAKSTVNHISTMSTPTQLRTNGTGVTNQQIQSYNQIKGKAVAKMLTYVSWLMVDVQLLFAVVWICTVHCRFHL